MSESASSSLNNVMIGTGGNDVLFGGALSTYFPTESSLSLESLLMVMISTNFIALPSSVGETGSSLVGSMCVTFFFCQFPSGSFISWDLVLYLAFPFFPDPNLFILCSLGRLVSGLTTFLAAAFLPFMVTDIVTVVLIWCEIKLWLKMYENKCCFCELSLCQLLQWTDFPAAVSWWVHVRSF